MWTFAAGLYNAVFSVPEYRVLIIGHEKSGKSVLMEQLKYMYHPNNISTGEQPSTAAAAAAAPSPSSSSPTAPLSSSPSSPHAASAAPTLSSRPGLGGRDGLAELRSVLRHSMAKQGDVRLSKGGHQPHVSGGSRRTAPSSAPAPVPAGTPTTAPPSFLLAKNIRPTVGMNYAKITHRYTPVPAGGAAFSSPSSSYAGSQQQQSLVMWDLGGEPALRPLWDNYFPQCQAVVFVLDSTLGVHQGASSSDDDSGGDDFVNDNASDNDKSNDGIRLTPVEASPVSVADSSDAGYGPFTPLGRHRRRHARRLSAEDLRRAKDVYRSTRATLEMVLTHPALRGVPVLILSNKADVEARVALADMQEAMDLAGLAATAAFYGDDGRGTLTSAAAATTTAGVTTPTKSAKQAADTTTTTTTADIGTSGFGRIVVRLAEVSALDGTGVGPAIDWLVAQLQRSAREVEREDGK